MVPKIAVMNKFIYTKRNAINKKIVVRIAIILKWVEFI